MCENLTTHIPKATTGCCTQHTKHTHIPRKRKKLVNGFREGRHGAPAGYIKWEESKLINTVRKTFFLFFVFFFFPSSSLISVRNARQHNNGQCRKECLAPETERSGATIDLLPIHLNPLWPVLDKKQPPPPPKKTKRGGVFFLFFSYRCARFTGGGKKEEEEEEIFIELTVATSRTEAKSNLIHCFIIFLELTFFFFNLIE